MPMRRRKRGLYLVDMQASSIAQENNEAQECQRAHADAMFEVDSLTLKLDDAEKFVRHTEKK